MRLETERLSNGLEAMFCQLPHFRSSSVRLDIKAGSLHDPEDAVGAAHFFEHVTFQGTESFDSIRDLNAFCNERSITKNALTALTNTTYLADGPELEPVLKVATELSLRPTLADTAMEGERKAIINEAAKIQFAQGYNSSKIHKTAIGGSRYARLGTGEVDDIQKITIDDLKSFYDRHYKIANALLLICSSEPIQSQRQMAEKLTSDIYEMPGADPQPEKLGLNWLNNDYRVSLAHAVDAHANSQTHANVIFNIENPENAQDSFRKNIAASVIGKLVTHRLREELVLAYAPSAGMSTIINRNFGLKELYSSFSSFASVTSEDAMQAIEELRHPIPDDKQLVDRMIANALYATRVARIRYRELPPNQLNEYLHGSPSTILEKQFFLPEDASSLSDDFAVQDIRAAMDETIQEEKLILVTSPDVSLLSQIESRYG